MAKRAFCFCSRHASILLWVKIASKRQQLLSQIITIIVNFRIFEGHRRLHTCTEKTCSLRSRGELQRIISTGHEKWSSRLTHTRTCERCVSTYAGKPSSIFFVHERTAMFFTRMSVSHKSLFHNTAWLLSCGQEKSSPHV